jgi:hypothetical protein
LTRVAPASVFVEHLRGRIGGAGLIRAIAAALLLVGCDGATTGVLVESVAVEAQADGGYGPLRLQLAPDMSPLALNLRAEHDAVAHEIGKWNSYRATLNRAGATVASGDFNINNTATPDNLNAPFAVQTMLIVRPAEGGEYELTIRPLRPVAVALRNVRVEVRRNVQEPHALPAPIAKP